ncbi:winged helix-turn-helix domain-containing protein [Allochromatium tepidum]|uniref:winged helix-turn-helix domain-containing protein n=1 Tax=Allochromatium tepidum TaxID=553982 RepID=UPI001F014C96|nr:LysR family transcriptional regulator [Allochromatium tepidum]
MRPRIYIGEALSIGPGKIDLLRLIGETRSISAAARALKMPYKRARFLIETLNVGFGRPVVATATGGKGGGGAILTPLGEALILRYDALEARINASVSAEIEAVRALSD